MPRKPAKRGKPKKRVSNPDRSSVISSLAKKLNPNRFTGMSPKMAALTGYIIGAKFTSPGIADIVVTSDGHVLARNEGDIGHNEYIGSYDAFKRNWDILLHVADLTPDENRVAMALFRDKGREI